MLFIDTGPFLARYLERDQYHHHAQRGWMELGAQPYRCYTSSFVIDEFLTLLARRSTGRFAAERGHRIYRLHIAFSFDRHFEIAGFIRWDGTESLSGDKVHDGGLRTKNT